MEVELAVTCVAVAVAVVQEISVVAAQGVEVVGGVVLLWCVLGVVVVVVVVVCVAVVAVVVR